MKSIRKLEDAYKATDIAYWAAWRAVRDVAGADFVGAGSEMDMLFKAMDDYKRARKARDRAWTALESRQQIIEARKITK